MRTEGETFHFCPSSRAAFLPVPSVAIPPLPFSPVRFSGLIERVFAFESRKRLPRFRCRPLKLSCCAGVCAAASAISVAIPNTLRVVRFFIGSSPLFTKSLCDSLRLRFFVVKKRYATFTAKRQRRE